MLSKAYQSGNSERIDYTERYIRALLNRATNVEAIKEHIRRISQPLGNIEPDMAAVLTRSAEFVKGVSFILLYLLVAKGTQKPLRCISAGCGLLLAKTNAPQRAVPTALLSFLTPPTPHTFFRLQCGRRITHAPALWAPPLT